MTVLRKLLICSTAEKIIASINLLRRHVIHRLYLKSNKMVPILSIVVIYVLSKSGQASAKLKCQ